MPDLRIISGAISPRNLRSAADRLPQIKNYVPRFGHFEKLNTGIKISKNLSVFTGWCFMKCGGRYPLEYRFTSSSGFLLKLLTVSFAVPMLFIIAERKADFAFTTRTKDSKTATKTGI